LTPATSELELIDHGLVALESGAKAQLNGRPPRGVEWAAVRRRNDAVVHARDPCETLRVIDLGGKPAVRPGSGQQRELPKVTANPMGATVK
jgi:hypothetical protein